MSNFGLGLGPYLRRPICCTLVDEYILGALFIALGEIRYMGSQNEYSLNIDFALPGTTCRIGGQTVLLEGHIVLEEDSDAIGQGTDCRPVS